jgi:hypothetical protein
MLAVLAFSIDTGYLLLARTEAQRSADAAAMAAACHLATENRLRENDEYAYHDAVRETAAFYAAANPVVGVNPQLDANQQNSPYGDIVLGRIDYLDDPQGSFTVVTGDPYNAVRVRVRRDARRNGQVELFFARIFGAETADVSAQATAIFIDQITGFRSPPTGTSTVMPFVVHEDTWQNWLDGEGEDNWAHDETTGTVSSGNDGVREFTLFASGNNNEVENGAITSGNFGTVDIGNPNNSTAELSRQIHHGPNASDFSYLPEGELKLSGTSNTLMLNGDTGISASMASALEDTLGEPRTLMLYREVTGDGNTTWFTIVGFIGVRVVDYSLTGQQMYIRVQPALVLDSSAIADTGGETPSWNVGTTVGLVQ